MSKKYNIKKFTFEDRFARKYYCQNARLNYLRYAKKANRRTLRRYIKKINKKEMDEI